MSDKATQTEGDANQGEGQSTGNQNLSLDERLSQLEKTNQRLLSESKEYKTKYQSLKEEQEKKEKDLLTQKEDWKKLLEQERKERDDERQKFKRFKHHNLSKLLEYEVLKHAPDVQDVSLVKQALPSDMIDAFEQDDEIKFTGIKEGLERIKKEKPFLFKPQNIPQMTNSKPGGQTAQSLNGGAKSLQQMTKEELLAYWKANAQNLR